MTNFIRFVTRPKVCIVSILFYMLFRFVLEKEKTKIKVMTYLPFDWPNLLLKSNIYNHAILKQCDSWLKSFLNKFCSFKTNLQFLQHIFLYVLRNCSKFKKKNKTLYFMGLWKKFIINVKKKLLSDIWKNSKTIYDDIIIYVPTFSKLKNKKFKSR